ncbi:MAG: hypothetical protein ACRCYR_07300 [Phycicoccus sp.]
MTSVVDETQAHTDRRLTAAITAPPAAAAELRRRADGTHVEDRR